MKEKGGKTKKRKIELKRVKYRQKEARIKPKKVHKK
jgi:hypothetical protein